MARSLSITGDTISQTHGPGRPRHLGRGVRFFLSTLYCCDAGREMKLDLAPELYARRAWMWTDTRVAEAYSRRGEIFLKTLDSVPDYRIYTLLVDINNGNLRSKK